MTKTTELAENYRQQFRGSGNHITSIDIKDAYRNGAQDMLERVCKYLLNIDYDSSRYIDFWENFNEELFVNDLCKAIEE